jgi:hypothetical protein
MRHAASLIFAIAIVLPAAPAAAQSPAAAQPQGPCFFTQPNYQGEPMCVAPLQRLPTLGPAKNNLMSVQIPPGMRVTVCDLENYSGSCQTLSQSTPDFTAINAAGKVGSIAAESSAPRAAPNEAAGPPPARQFAAPPPPAAAPPAKQFATPPPPAAAPPAKQFAAPPPPAAAPPAKQFAAPPPPAAAPPAKQFAPPPPPAAGPPPSPSDPEAAGARAEREAEYIRELRRQLLSLRKECEDGEKIACVRLGFLLGENRGRRSALRQQHPELFWWDQ